jgi:hypothetical protein
VACVVDLAGDVDLAAYQAPPELHEVVALLGGTYQEVPERYRDASPLSWIDRETAPFLVIHGDQDDVVRLRSRNAWWRRYGAPGSKPSTSNSPTPATTP